MKKKPPAKNKIVLDKEVLRYGKNLSTAMKLKWLNDAFKFGKMKKF